MHRLVIVAGPNRGSAFQLTEGENTIGRQMDNHIVLTSSKVSKRHCALLVTTQEVILRDEGSTNGTFVNGALARRQTMKPGDKLGVGEFVLELVRSGVPAQISTGQTGSYSNPLDMGIMPSNPFDLTGGAGALSLPGASPAPLRSGPANLQEARFDDLAPKQDLPEDLPGKLKFLFEGKIMPTFYGMLMKSELGNILAGLLGVTLLISVFASVMPMENMAEQGIQREAKIRGTVLAREIADRYAPHFVNHSESQIDFSLLSQEESIKIVALLNMDLNIVAPQSRLGQLFSVGGEAAFARKMVKEYREGREKGGGMFLDANTYVHVEPIKAADPRTYANEVVALALVSIDFSRNMVSAGGLEIAYGSAIIYTALIGLLFYFILLRLTQKPYEVMNDDLDQVLRGEIPKVTKEFKVGTLEKLWDNVNAAVQRMGKGEPSGDEGSVMWDQEFAPWIAITETGQMGLIGFDANLVMVTVNAFFSDLSGIRSDSVGQTLGQVGDQAMNSLVTEMKSSAERSGTRTATDKFEFQGIDYSVVATLVGPKDQAGIALLFRKKET